VLEPTSEAERILALDALRGLGVLGILAVACSRDSIVSNREGL